MEVLVWLCAPPGVCLGLAFPLCMCALSRSLSLSLSLSRICKYILKKENKRREKEKQWGVDKKGTEGRRSECGG